MPVEAEYFSVKGPLHAKSGLSMLEGASVNSTLILGMAYRKESTALVSSSSSAQVMRRVKQIKQVQ